MALSHEAIYRRMIEEGFNQGNLAVVDELVAPGAREHQRGAEDGIEGTKRTINYLRSAFPDFTITIDEVVVVGRQGLGPADGRRHQPRQLRRSPANRDQSVHRRDRPVRIEDGKIVEHWGVPDQLGMMMSLGHIAKPTRPAPVTASPRRLGWSGPGQASGHMIRPWPHQP